MGYTEDNDGNAVLTLTREDYILLNTTLGFILGSLLKSKLENPPSGAFAETVLGLVNRMNNGNPTFTPYGVVGQRKVN